MAWEPIFSQPPVDGPYLLYLPTTYSRMAPISSPWLYLRITSRVMSTQIVQPKAWLSNRMVPSGRVS